MTRSLSFAAVVVVLGATLYVGLCFALVHGLNVFSSEGSPDWFLYIAPLANALAPLGSGAFVGAARTGAPARLGFAALFIGSVGFSLLAGNSTGFFLEAETELRSGYILSQAIGTGLIGMCGASYGHYILAVARSNPSLERP